MLGKGTDGMVLDLGDRVGRTMGWMLLCWVLDLGCYGIEYYNTTMSLNLFYLRLFQP